jgi:RNA-directed DNA polymerase
MRGRKLVLRRGIGASVTGPMRIARPTRHQRCACEAVAIVRAQPIPWDRYRQIKRKFCTIVGGVLSPLLSNLVLDELDRELERRGHRFVRYADDGNIYVRSEKAGRRVMTSLTRFIEGRLKLQINAQKSALARPWQRSFLGFTVTDEPQPRRRIADKAVTRFKDRVRVLTRRHRGVSLDRMIADLNPLLRGWAGYFGFSQLHELASLDGGIRRRLRCVIWVQWKTRGRRYKELRRLKVSEKVASAAIFSPKGPWRLSSAGALHRAFTNKRFKGLGLFSMETLAGA